jgi:hypothetical protein
MVVGMGRVNGRDGGTHPSRACWASSMLFLRGFRALVVQWMWLSAARAFVNGNTVGFLL